MPKETETITFCFVSPQRKRQWQEPWSGANLDEIAEQFLPEGGGYTIAIDGKVIEPDFWESTFPPAGSTITFVPDFGFLPLLLAWALPTIFGAGTVIGSSVLLTTVISIIGYIGLSYLINSLMPKPPKADSMGGAGGQNVWDPQTTQQEGLPIPRHYGVYRAHGNIIAAYTEPGESSPPGGWYRKQIIHALIAFADGPIAAIDAADVRMQNIPIGQFDGVTCETRRGLLVQTATTHFQQTRLQFRVNYELKLAEGWWEFELPDDDYDDIEIDLRLDLWYRRESGKAGTASASYDIEIDEVGGGSWTSVLSHTSEDNRTDLHWKLIVVSSYYAITRGTRYKLRFRRTNQEADEDRIHNHVFVESIKEVIDVAFQYPGMVLAEISGVASDRFSGIMDVSALLEYRVVNAWNGSWALADDEDTVAWALWDLWTLPVISGDGGGTPYAIEEYLGFEPARIDATDHYTLALYGNGLVPDAEGGTEKRFSCNGIINTESTMWDVALKLCEIGRCLPIYNGNVIHLAINKAKTRSAMMSVGSILTGSFEETFAPIIDAAGEIEATFDDAARDYEHHSLPFANPNIVTQQNKVSMALWGLVKQTEVIRHIKFRLLQTELRQRALLVSGDIETLTYEVGNLIGVQEDVTDWGELGTRGGGRVLDFEGGLSSALLAHWKMNDNAANTTVLDSSGNANNGIAQQNTEDLHVDGKINGAFNFTATDYVDITNVASLIAGTGNVTFSVWVKTASSAEGVILVSGTNADKQSLYFHCDGTYLNFGTYGHGGGSVPYFLMSLITDNAWHYIVGVKNGDVLSIYLDGILRDQKTMAGINLGSTYAWIGASALSLIGAIDMVMIFNRALTADEVSNLFNGGNGTETFPSQAVVIDHNLVDAILPATGYELCIRLANAESDSLKTVDSVESVPDRPAASRVVIVEPFPAGTIPQRGDLWAFGKTGKALKDFTIEAIEQTGRLQRKLTLLEYDAACYDGDSEVPVVPIPSATPARVDRHILAPPTPRHIAGQAPAAAMEFPTIDAGITTNVTWNSNTPGAGQISWSATDAAEPLLYTWRGIDYEITAANTDKQFVYFDSTVTDFVATDTFADCFGTNKIPVCVNDDGTAVPYLGLGAFHAALITNLSVATLKIADNAVTIPVSAYSAADETTGDVQTVALSATGAPIFIFGGLVSRRYFDFTGVKNYQLKIIRKHSDLFTDLVAYWPMDDDATSTPVLDVSGADHSAILQGGKTTADVHVTGQIGTGAFSYDGVNDYVEDDDAFWDDIFKTGIAWSISFWCQPTSAAKDAMLIYKVADPKYFYLKWDDSSEEWRVSLNDGTNSVYVTKAAADPTASWHHIVVTYDGAGDLRMYIDGVAGTQGKTGTGIPDFGTTANLIIGNSDYEGKMDAVMVWERVISAAEITLLFNEEEPLVTLYNTGSCTVDVSVTGNKYFPVSIGIEDTPPEGDYDYYLNWTGDFYCKERVLYAIQTKK